MQILVFHCTEIIESLYFNQFFASFGLKICWHPDNSCRNSWIWYLFNKFLFSSHRIITNISKHHNSMLIILECVLWLKVFNVSHSFIKTSRNGSSSALEITINLFFNLSLIHFRHKLTLNNCASLIVESYKRKNIVLF